MVLIEELERRRWGHGAMEALLTVTAIHKSVDGAEGTLTHNVYANFFANRPRFRDINLEFM